MRLFLHQLRGEQLLFWRSREAAVFVFVFPLLLFVLLAAVYTGKIYGGRRAWVLLAGHARLRRRANTAFAGLALMLVAPGGRDPEADPRDAAAAPPPTSRRARLDADRVRVPGDRAVRRSAALLRRALPAPSVSLVLALAARRRSLRRARARDPALIRSAEGSSAIINVIILPMAFLSGSFGPTRHYPAVPAGDRGRAAAEVPRRLHERDLPAGAELWDSARFGRRARGVGAVGGSARRGPALPLGAARGLGPAEIGYTTCQMQIEQTSPSRPRPSRQGSSCGSTSACSPAATPRRPSSRSSAKLVVPAGRRGLARRGAAPRDRRRHGGRRAPGADRGSRPTGSRQTPRTARLEGTLVSTAEFWTRACVADRHAEITEF